MQELEYKNWNITNRNALIISLEGIDYTGKTSICNMLKKSLTKKLSRDVIFLSDPPLIEPWVNLKNLFEMCEEIDKLSEAILLLSARIDYLNRIIKPNLLKGAIIILDRYTDSWFVYQSIRLRSYFGSQEKAMNFLISINQILENNDVIIPPHKTIFLTVDIENLIKRMMNRNIISKYEQIEFLMEVQKKYLLLANNEKKRFIIIDTSSKSLYQLHKEIEEKILSLTKYYTIIP